MTPGQVEILHSGEFKLPSLCHTVSGSTHFWSRVLVTQGHLPTIAGTHWNMLAQYVLCVNKASVTRWGWGPCATPTHTVSAFQVFYQKSPTQRTS